MWKKIPELNEPIKEEPSTITLPSAIEIRHQSQSQDESSPTLRYQPKLYHPSMKAPWPNRCLACAFDSGVQISSKCICYTGYGIAFESLNLSFETWSCCIGPFCCSLPFVYWMSKDGLKDRPSIGKEMLNLRVIDHHTGMPATIGQSCIRNCLCSCADCICCPPIILIDPDGRKITDYIAGTVVIIDE